ncbi:hypothetical protein OsccyDRAFT_1090 [Leptolyngbyaceae cyanobacterium JSC-12]|nr:hypothetical protein OsccyDRAFT_1090 [Leptolyngbyaceae cyanobacterium JSC-12]
MSIKKSISTKKSINVWSYKPWWCQPWSILLTGCGVVGGSWWLFHRIWLTGFITVPILTWMGFFLLVYPRLFAQSMQQEIEVTQTTEEYL